MGQVTDFACSGRGSFMRFGSRILCAYIPKKLDLVGLFVRCVLRGKAARGAAFLGGCGCGRTRLGGSGGGCQFVPAFPAHFYFAGRRHPTSVGALTRDAGEFARAARKHPGTLKGGLAASSGYLALECTPVPVLVRVLVNEVAALD